MSRRTAAQRQRDYQRRQAMAARQAALDEVQQAQRHAHEQPISEQYTSPLSDNQPWKPWVSSTERAHNHAEHTHTEVANHRHLVPLHRHPIGDVDLLAQLEVSSERIEAVLEQIAEFDRVSRSATEQYFALKKQFDTLTEVINKSALAYAQHPTPPETVALPDVVRRGRRSL